MSTKRKILIGVLALITLLIGVFAVMFAMSGKERELASTFVTDLAKNDTTKAYDLFSRALKKVQSQETFEAQVATLGLDPSCELEITGIEGKASTESRGLTVVSGKVVCDDKTIPNAEFTFDSREKLYGYTIKE